MSAARKDEDRSTVARTAHGVVITPLDVSLARSARIALKWNVYDAKSAGYPLASP